MKLWSSWLPDLLPHVPGCLNVVAEHELRRAAQVFFQKTRAWQINPVATPVSAGNPDVTVITGDDSVKLVRVESARLDGRPLTKETADNLDVSFTDDWHNHTGAPDSYVEFTPGVIRLYPIPLANSVTGLRMRLSVTPSETSLGLPDDIAARFQDEIHVGAKARLMVYPDAQWSNTTLAVGYAQAFSDMMDTTVAAVARSYGAARIPSRPKWS